jgi:hypothetical protein
VAGSIGVTVRPYWLGAWFLRLMSRPFVRVDGAEHPTRWGVPSPIAAEPGSHTVACGIRYRGFSGLLGARNVKVRVNEGQTLHMIAKNGPLNSEPFYVEPVR